MVENQPTLKVGDWVNELQDAGVGEILLTSVDQEGTKKGFDINLIQYVDSIANRPIIVSGGYGIPLHAQIC